MTRPLVSIVTPVLNRAEQMEACLRSVSEQTYPNIEHIVVDGGSTDGTLEKIASFRGNHEIRSITGRDKGMYDAINKGFRLANGEFLAYLNSDDLYLPWSVEKAVDSLIDLGRDIVYGDLAVMVKGPKRLGFYVEFYRPFDINFYTHFETLGQPTVFWTRDLAVRVGDFDTSYQLLGDCEYWLRAAAAGAHFEHLVEILAVQVEHPGTLRATRGPELRAEFRRLRASYAEVAGAPRTRFARVRRTIRWRWLQSRFVIAAHRSSPASWPNFMSYLEERQISITASGLFWYLLPGPLRPAGIRLLDADSLQRALGAR